MQLRYKDKSRVPTASQLKGPNLMVEVTSFEGMYYHGARTEYRDTSRHPSQWHSGLQLHPS